MAEKTPPFQVIRGEDFTEKYANNVRLETSVWDLRMVFGVFASGGALEVPATVTFHSAINIPWAQVKLLAFFLQANVWFHEQSEGKIAVPSGLIPPLFKSEEMEKYPGGKELIERLAKLHSDTF